MLTPDRAPLLQELRAAIARADDAGLGWSPELEWILTQSFADILAERLIDGMTPGRRTAFVVDQFRRLKETNGLASFKAELELLAAEVPASP